VALAECAFRGEEPGLGGHFELPGSLRPDVLLFAETPSRMIVTTREEAHLRAAAHRHEVPCHRLGTVEGRQLALLSGSRVLVSLPVEELHRAWMSLERLLDERAAQ
jgi:phosphoribosylformylglycinamidine (FGAM) synthase-like enzyme